MRLNFGAAVAAAALMLGFGGGALAAKAPPAPPAAAPPKADADQLPPFPADASARQSVRVGGKALNYTATVGSLPVRDETGKKIGEVVYTAYHLDGGGAERPVTFAFNGGPGAASVYLNLGAIGPKRVQFGAQGDSPSSTPTLTDNQGTWLPFTDLVFIDPIGTGFSRSLVTPDETKKRFFTMDTDIAYLSRIVFDWLVKNERLSSPHYVIGESYGGYRAPRLTHYLQTQMGVGVTGLIMVSPALDGAFHVGQDSSPMAWMQFLPSMAAANYERQGKPLNEQTMAEVEAYARGEYVLDFLKGQTDPAALDRMVKRVAAYTGLDESFVRTVGGRVESRVFLRELYRREGKLGSWYDSNVTAYDPFPFAATQQTGDPILDGIVAPTTSAMVDFVTRTVGWKVDARYFALNGAVNNQWEPGWWQSMDAVTDLRQALAIDPKMRVMIAHGYDDLSVPYLATKVIVDQIPTMGGVQRVKLGLYPGGHMFYSRADSSAAFTHDVMALYGIN